MLTSFALKAVVTFQWNFLIMMTRFLVTNVNVDYSRFLFSTVTPVTYIEKMLSYKNWQQPWNVKTCFAWSWIFSDDNEHTKKKIMFSKQRERERERERYTTQTRTSFLQFYSLVKIAMFVFFNMGQNLPLFVYSRTFSMQWQIKYKIRP